MIDKHLSLPCDCNFGKMIAYNTSKAGKRYNQWKSHTLLKWKVGPSKKFFFYCQADRKGWPPPPPTVSFSWFLLVCVWPHIMNICVLEHILQEMTFFTYHHRLSSQHKRLVDCMDTIKKVRFMNIRHVSLHICSNILQFERTLSIWIEFRIWYGPSLDQGRPV